MATAEFTTPREQQRFTSKDDAIERTVRALVAVGFTVECDVNRIEGVPVETYSGHESRGDGPVPDIAAVYTEENGNLAFLGLGVNSHDLQRGPYNWYGQSVRLNDLDPTLLDSGGNHDSSQSELISNILALLGTTHFGKPIGHTPTWTKDYKVWEAATRQLLEPIIYGTDIDVLT